MRIAILVFSLCLTPISLAQAQAWRNCIAGSIGPGGCESIGPGGGQSIGPGGGLSIGPGGGQSIGPGGGRALDRDTTRGLDPYGLQGGVAAPYGAYRRGY